MRPSGTHWGPPPLLDPHSAAEVTAFEAYMDLYMLTGDSLYLDGVMGAWHMLRDHWLHPGGSFALNEGTPYPPDSYYLTAKPTGETCGSVFWIKLNQRLARCAALPRAMPQIPPCRFRL